MFKKIEAQHWVILSVFSWLCCFGVFKVCISQEKVSGAHVSCCELWEQCYEYIPLLTLSEVVFLAILANFRCGGMAGAEIVWLARRECKNG